MKLKKHGSPAFTQVIGPIASGFSTKTFCQYMNEGIIRDYCRLVCNLEFSQIEEQIMDYALALIRSSKGLGSVIFACCGMVTAVSQTTATRTSRKRPGKWHDETPPQ